MTEQSIGTARLDIVVETTNMEAGIERAKKAQDGLAASSERASKRSKKAQDDTATASARAAQTVEQNSRRQIAALEKAATTLGFTKDEMIRYRIVTQTTGAEQKRLLSILDQSTARLNQQGRALNQYGLSAKQQAAALRQVPAQITDIFTSLASGQRPLTVLLQQGGQLKDIFGGVVPAARALGGAVASFINPLTIAIGVVAALGAAWKSAQDEMLAFNTAIIQTGGFAGHTADDLKAMAARLDETTGATQRFASEVIAQVEATGRFTGQQVETISTAITNMAKATAAAGGDADEAIKSLTKSFTDLSKDPVEALLKLNETQHFLTQSTLDQVQSLVQQGKEAEAAEVAINALADTTNSRAKQMEGSLNSVNAVWRDMKGAIGEAWDSTVGFFRDADAQMQTFLRNNERAVRAAATLTRTFNPFAPNIADSLINNAKTVPEPIMIGFKQDIDSGKARRDIKAVEDAQRGWDSAIRQSETDMQRLNRELKELEKNGKLLKQSPEDIKAAQDALRASFAKKGSKGRSDGIESANSRAAIQAFEDQLKKEQGLIQNQTKLLEANYAARNITVERYYAEQKRLAQENNAAQVKALEGEITALQSRSLKGKDSINNARELAEKEAALAKVRADGATALEVLNIQEAAQLKQRKQANIAYADALDAGREALKAELDSQVLRITVGEREFEIRSRIIQLYRDEAKELLNLARQRDAGEIDPETYRARVEQLKAAIADEVQIVKDGYDQMAKAQANWANGALKAFADYRDAANDVAGQTYGIFTNALNGLEDVFVDFFTKGKADWKGFFDDIGAEITRFVVRQQLNKLIKKFIPGMGEEGGDNAAALSGAAGKLAASAAPLYGAAAALSASAAALAAAGAGSAASGGGSSLTGLVGLMGSFFKDGGGFSGGVQYFARGDVFDRPTAFGMRNGIGVMGEAGPEAVMLLKRGPDGSLGVQVVSEPRRITRGGDTYIQVQGAPNKQTLKQLERANGRGARREMARTGS